VLTDVTLLTSTRLWAINVRLAPVGCPDRPGSTGAAGLVPAVPDYAAALWRHAGDNAPGRTPLGGCTLQSSLRTLVAERPTLAG